MLISDQHWIPGSRASRSNFFSFPDPPRSCGSNALPEVARHFQPLLVIRPVSRATKTSRLGEAHQVGWDGHAHVVPPARQLTTDNDARLDIAAHSVEYCSTNLIA